MAPGPTKSFFLQPPLMTRKLLICSEEMHWKEIKEIKVLKSF